MDVANNVVNSVKHAADGEDKRLGALVAVKGYKDADKVIKDIKGNGGGKVNENCLLMSALAQRRARVKAIAQQQ